MTGQRSEVEVPPTDGDTGAPPRHVPSPEERAREFLRGGGSTQGGGVAPQQRNQGVRRRPVRIPRGVGTAAGIVAALAVLALLTALMLLPSHPPSAPRVPSGKPTHPTHGRPSTSASTISNTLPPPASVKVDVLNAYGSAPLGAATAARLRQAGFAIGTLGQAPSLIAGGQPSEIHYGPNGLRAAETLAPWLIGAVKEVPSATLSGNHLQLWIANPWLSVNETTTTTTTPSIAQSSPATP